MIKKLLYHAFNTAYRMELKGFTQLELPEARLLIIANHASSLDPLLLASILPSDITFVVPASQKSTWQVRLLACFATVKVIDPFNPKDIISLIDHIKSGHKTLMFPEWRVSTTGSLMKIYETSASICDKAEAALLPLYIHGFAGKRLFPKITCTMLSPRKLNISSDIKGKERILKAKGQLYDLMSEMVVEGGHYSQTLFSALLHASRQYGPRHIIAEDIERKPLSYRRLLAGSFILGEKIASTTQKGEYVGLMLPNVTGGLVTFFALQATGRIPAVLNFTAGSKNVVSACRTAKINTVLSSRAFIEKAALQELVSAIEETGVRFLYLDDVRKEITVKDKLKGLMKATFIGFMPPHEMMASPSDPAVVLFTSGSEGTPKGVVLSHQNILANCLQLRSRMDFVPTDIVFNVLPLFHSSGLTGGTLLPVFSGMKVFFYPSPLHYKEIPELVYDSNATILFATDTFLAGYAKYADPYDFYKVRYVFAGAEKLKEETRHLWSEKYGVRIFEAYGATETAPGLTLNTPMYNQAGSVGRFLPCIEHKLEQVPGIAEGGRLKVKGPNVMLGYLFSDHPGQIVPPEEGWYDTGDIVAIDEEGYVTIKGRAKRFAKIGGEMVSLTAVETCLAYLWKETQHAVVSVPDEKKGEHLVLVTNCKEAEREPIVLHFKQQGRQELAIPKHIIVVDEMPLLGTGKTDYVGVQKLAEGARHGRL